MHDYDSSVAPKNGSIKTEFDQDIITSVFGEIKDPTFCLWKEKRGTKVPFQALINREASSIDPTTWSPLDVCVDRAKRRNIGVGLQFGLGDGPFIGIDLDDCIEDGQLNHIAKDVVEHFHTYTEVSPSGTGVKLYLRGTYNGPHHNFILGFQRVEIYGSKRFFALTGNHVDGTPMHMVEAQQRLDQWVATLDVENKDDDDGDGRAIVFESTEFTTAIEDCARWGSVKSRQMMLRRWLEKRPGSTAGQNKGAGGYCLVLCSSALFGFVLSPEVVLEEMLIWGTKDSNRDEHGRHYPWKRHELAHKIKAAVKRPYRGRYLGDLLTGTIDHPELATIPSIQDQMAQMGLVEGSAVSTTFFDGVTIDYTMVTDRDEAACESCRVPEPMGANGLHKGSEYIEDTAIDFADPLVESHLDCETVAMILGESMAHKTFLAVALAMCISLGIKFLGLFRVKQGPVIYVCGEGPRGIKKRFHGWMQHNKKRPNKNLLLITRPLDLSNPDDIEWLIAEAKRAFGGKMPVAIFFDTLSSLNRGDEGTANVAQVLAHMQRLREELHTTPILVHHPGKDKTKGARGSSMWLNNLDNHINVDRQDKQLSTVHSGKMKDDEEFKPYAVSFQRITLFDANGKEMHDRFGKLVTTLVAEASSTTIEQLETAKQLSDLAEERAKWVRLLPVDAAEAFSVQDVIATGVAKSPTTVLAHLANLVREELATRLDGDGSRYHPHRWHRSDKGGQFLVTFDAKSYLPTTVQLPSN